MPRYYFHTEDGVRDIDREGEPFADDQEALSAGVLYAAGMLGDDPGLLAEGMFRVFVVEAGRTAFVIETVVKVGGDPGLPSFSPRLVPA